MNHLKSLEITWISFKYNIFCFQNFSKSFREYIRMENLHYKNKTMERKYLKNMRNNQFLKGKHSFRIGKGFYGIKRQRIKKQKRKY